MSNMDTSANDDLIQEIASFCEAHEISPTAFGKRALNDPAFVTTLKRGRDVGRKTERRMRAFMAEVAMAARRNTPIGPSKAAPDA